MSWLFGDQWPWVLLGLLLGAGITAFLMLRKVSWETLRARTSGVGGAATAEAGVAATDGGTEAAEPAMTVAAEVEAEESGTSAEPVAWAHAEDQTEPVAEAHAEDQTEPVLDADAATAAAIAEEGADQDTQDASRVDADAEADLAAVEPGAYPGSAAARADRSMPTGYPIKGNEDSMLFHTEDSPYYGRTIAEVWFDTESNAEAAGFTRWDRRERKSAGAGVVGLAALPPESSHGPGTADPLPDGSSPHESFTIKGNADSMLYHPVDSPYYGRTIAEVWFDSEENAERAGFTHWKRKRAGEVKPLADVPAVEPGAYPGSAAARADRSMPAGYPIKGNEDSMLYHPEDSPYYGRTIAEVWFDTEENAEKAGFTHWKRNRK